MTHITSIYKMGAPAISVWLPLLLMAMAMVMATLAIPQQSNDTKSSSSNDESNSPSTTTPSTRTSTSGDLVVGGDLNNAARVEQMNLDLDRSLRKADTATTTVTTPKSTDGAGYDVIDVLAATNAGVGRPKSGQTTRIYTTGEVNDDFWLKHLGEDFKHAIHLQVGGTNDDYNRLINQTSDNGVHEEVHHEYLPGAERPHDAQHHPHRSSGYNHNHFVSQSSLDSEAMALKHNYLRQEEQQQQRFSHSYTQPNTHYTMHNRHRQHTYPQLHTQHTQHAQHIQHTQHTQHTHSRGSKSRRYKQTQNHNPILNQAQPALSSSSFINSSEDTLHTAQSQATPSSANSPSSSSPLRDNHDSQLPFKSPFNDYGSRPTRDLTYLLYKRGL